MFFRQLEWNGGSNKYIGSGFQDSLFLRQNFCYRKVVVRWGLVGILVFLETWNKGGKVKMNGRMSGTVRRPILRSLANLRRPA
jgi:hypothetical protein